MKTISLVTGEGKQVAAAVRVADTFAERAIGLLRRDALRSDEGLLLLPASSVHTFGMRFAIDIVFLDRRMRVLNVSPHVPPRRLCIGPPGAARVLELPCGRIAEAGLLIGAYVLVADDTETQLLRPAIATTTVARPPIQFSLRLPPTSIAARACPDVLPSDRST